MKKRKWSGLKEGIILYLAISKIMYWMSIVGEMAQHDFEGALPYVLDRIANRDLPIILVIICLIILDRINGNHYVKLAIGYAGFIGVVFIYTVTMQWIFEGSLWEGLLFFRDSFVGFTIQFVIISVLLSLKERFMKKVEDKQ